MNFVGDKITYVKSNRVSGVSKKTQKDYDFGQLTVSDGLESMTLPCNPTVAESAVNKFTRGEKVVITIDAKLDNFDNVRFEVCDIKPAAIKTA